ncbi:MAG: poly-beta-1,6 N-acetyl-D-glucosamine synthase [Thermoflavifilum sp.]|nr:poly-beta-1,6 N-acetyl-D-glucosamine synthase [Thermoflavifilum sp.]MCL6514085.1 poly-beta-1,6 N-acetyl-D-glucosamine synthase [Alicyclobacillus sp.]
MSATGRRCTVALFVYFVFAYPFIMSLVWMMGALVFYWRRERGTPSSPPVLEEAPLVSILVPAFNEARILRDTLTRLRRLTYPNYEVLILDDGSTDETSDVLREAMEADPRLRVVHLSQRRGKAHALNAGVYAARGELLITVDADAVLHPDAIQYLVAHFIQPGGERVGAVTGNPRIRNRATLLAKIQLVEYGSIIGLIKRAQRVLGKVMTVSGVIAAFRKRAVLDCGLWDEDMVTDDIAISWKLQRRAWDIRYEPKALCWMWVPETVRGLCRQRMRWVQGGIEVLIRHRDILVQWRQRRLVPVYLEEALGVVWAYAWTVSTLWLCVQALRGQVPWNLVQTGGTCLGLMSLVQSATALCLEKRYESGPLARYYFYAIWYPAVYWMLGAMAVVMATPRAIVRTLRAPGRYAVWSSPDRGVST